MNTLQRYLYHHDYRAEDGNHGEWKDRYGADGDDLEMPLPLGTVIKDEATGHILHQITEHGERRLAAHGGQWGIGNMHFKTAVMQYPEFATLGEPGTTRDLVLELQLLGDVALIGTPSTGKSTIINASSNAKAKIWAYHFTTIVPNLGMVHHNQHHFTMIDIPGLIKDAHEGKWLGNAFLRHVLKAHAFCFIHDLSQYESGMDDALTLMEEIREYIIDQFVGSTDFEEPIVDVTFAIQIIDRQIHRLTYLHFEDEEPRLFMDKMLVFVLNKYDLINDQEIVDMYRDELMKHVQQYFGQTFSFDLTEKNIADNTFVISGATRYGLDHFLTVISQKLKDYDFTNEVTLDLVETHQTQLMPIIDITETGIEHLVEHELMEQQDTKFIKVRQINDPAIIAAWFQTMWGNDQWEQRFWRKIESLWFNAEAERIGIRYGDVIRLPAGDYSDQEDKWVQWML